METRDFKGPRNYEDSGMPLHLDNQSIVKERLSLDKANPDILKNEITVIDHALTRPWTVVKNYHRIRDGRMFEDLCNESNNHVQIGKENYFMSADGYLMPAKKDQPPRICATSSRRRSEARVNISRVIRGPAAGPNPESSSF